jgi:uncharacterized membrane protein
VAFCSNCGTQLAEGAGCPKCAGTAPSTSAPIAGTTTAGTSTGGATTAGAGLTDNMAGALAYVTIIPAIVFLVAEPFNKNRFIRFHAFQCIFFAVAWTVLWIALEIIVRIPILGWATILLWPLVSLAGLIIWIILVMKAYQGQTFKLPVIGDMAEKQANTV